MNGTTGSRVTVVADDWDAHWSGFSESAQINPAQHYRHRLVAEQVASFAPRRVLDIGSGQGDLLERLASELGAGVDLVGIELSEVGVRAAAAKVPSADVRQVDLMAPDAAARLAGIDADVATCCEVLEHLDDPVAFLKSARHALAPGCLLVVTVPGGPRSAFDKLIGHRRHYEPEELRAVLTEAGYRVIDAVGAGFPFFNLYRLVIVSRGDKLAEDVGTAEVSRLARVVMAIFGVLFRWNRRTGRRGWQTMAVAVAATARVTGDSE